MSFSIVYSGVTDDLSAVVHTCPRVQESLGPALLHTYAAVDVIEGLDVDKEEFDKYGSRSLLAIRLYTMLSYILEKICRFEITRLIENLWKRQDCKASILAQTSTEKFKVILKLLKSSQSGGRPVLTCCHLISCVCVTILLLL